MDARKQQNFDVEGGAPHGGIGTAPPKDFDEEADLPITANRTAKWWYVAVHNVTAMVGAGVLGLPYALSLLGEMCTVTLRSVHAQATCNFATTLSVTASALQTELSGWT